MKIESYDIELDVDFEHANYRGREKIRLDSSVESIVLNCLGPVIDNVTINNQSALHSKGKRDDEVLIRPASGKFSDIEIDFHAEVSKSLMGLYLAKTADGKTMFTTQFESTGARMAFPCLDDPSYKAVFRLSLIIDSKLDAISNMPVSSQKEKGSRKTIKFQETPRMSTYLLYIGIGEFETIEGKHRDKKIYFSGLKGALNSNDFPIIVGAQSLEFFDEYFGIKYALPKMHLISVPEFGAGAMENWGAITFRETAILVNENTSGLTKKRVASVIAHEIAHQWFGDLVTMKWWNDLWLNESFATFMMYKVVDRYYPKWNIIGEMLQTRASGALTDDSLKSTHPINVDVKDPETVAQIFDQISYGKGGMILRMIEGYAGNEMFREGIHDYLSKFAYSNATGSDLWKSIESRSGKPVSRVMEAWINRPGYPYLSVKRKDDKIEIRQKKFYLDGSSSNELWPVPVTIKRKNKIESILLENESIEIEGKDFVKLNASETGFYRVLYDESLYSQLLSNLQDLTFEDRWGIASDLFAFLVSGHINISNYLDHVKRFEKEDEYAVIQEISSNLQQLLLINPKNSRIKEIALSFYRKQLQRIGDKSGRDDINEGILRGMLNSRLSDIDPEHAAKLSGLFQTIEKQDPNMRTAIAIAAARHFGKIDPLIEKFLNLKSDEDRVKVISAMGMVPGKDAMDRVIQLMDAGKIKKQDITSYFTSIGIEPLNRDLAFRALPEIVKRMSDVFVGTGTPSRLVYQLTQYIGLGRLRETKSLLEKIRTPLIDQGISKGLESLEINEKLLLSIS